MLEISDEMIKEIAGELDCGMKCFYHLQTGELICFPDELKMGEEIDEEAWGEEIAKIEEEPDLYLEFTVIESHESFRVMEDFIGQISDDKIRHQFEEVILRRKPFQQFKNLLFDYPDHRQQWFAYKEQRYMEYVKEQVEAFNSRLK